MSIEPGRYKATIEDYGIKTVGDKKTPQMNIKFKTVESGLAVYFQNFLTAGTTGSEYFTNLMNTLVETGALRTKKFTDIAKGVQGGAFDTSVELEVVCDYEKNDDGSIKTDANGKSYVKVNFINNPDKSGMKGVLAEEEAITVLGGLNLDAHILQAEQRTGASIDSKPAHTGNFSDDNIPF